MSAARARRRLMRHERAHRRARLLGIGIRGFVGHAHHRAWVRVYCQQQGQPFMLREPYRRSA